MSSPVEQSPTAADEELRDVSATGDDLSQVDEPAAETAEGDNESQNEGEEEDDEGEVDQQIVSSIQRAPAPQTEVGDDDDEPAMTQAEIRSKQINQQIDIALRVGKKRPKKRKAGEEDLDQLADEEVERLKQDMIAAADMDIDANENKRPATEKLKLLPKVVSTLQKSHLQQSIMDNNLLEGVKRWLEPLPDRSLPALNIQRQFFTILEKMQIDEISLKMSGLGKIVLFYSVCPRIEPAIKRTAEKLIEVWSRPILKRSSSYRTRAVPQAEYHGIDDSQDNLTQLSQADSSRRNVRIPQAVQTGYTYAPKSTAGAIGQEESHQARLTNHRRLNDFKGRLKGKR